jgi:hypothetical protein
MLARGALVQASLLGWRKRRRHSHADGPGIRNSRELSDVGLPTTLSVSIMDAVQTPPWPRFGRACAGFCASTTVLLSLMVFLSGLG